MNQAGFRESDDLQTVLVADGRIRCVRRESCGFTEGPANDGRGSIYFVATPGLSPPRANISKTISRASALTLGPGSIPFARHCLQSRNHKTHRSRRSTKAMP